MTISKRVKNATLIGLCSLNLVSVSSIAAAEEPLMLINYGVSGSWYEPATSGQGFVIDILPLNNLLAAYWFTYPVEGGARDWYLATGDINGDSVELTIYQTENGVFDEASMVETNAVGNASLEFSSCEAASWTYQIDTLGLSGEIPLQRIAPDQMCEQFLATANANVVSHTNAWVDIRGDWLFEGCVNLENSDSHGNELFTFTETTVILKIDRYSNPDCTGTFSLQTMTLDMQRVDKTLALLDGEDVIANRYILTDVDSGQETRLTFYVDDRGDELLLTHGVLDESTDSEGFPIELHPPAFKRAD
ncbi:MAG: hypothetical protein GQ538_02760 [Xanthomonadales bacterium]|nr:hypothetical protein [Xanthomonadales bacterium]